MKFHGLLLAASAVSLARCRSVTGSTSTVSVFESNGQMCYVLSVPRTTTSASSTSTEETTTTSAPYMSTSSGDATTTPTTTSTTTSETTTTTTTTTTTSTATTTTTSATSTPSGECEPVTDNSFESVPASAIGVENVSGGGWTVQNGAIFVKQGGTNNGFLNTKTGGSPKYGTQWVAFEPRASTTASLSQTLAGTYGSYTLYYWVSSYMSSNACSFIVAYNGVNIDSFTPQTANTYVVRRNNMVTVTGPGVLEFKLQCVPVYVDSGNDFIQIDSVGLYGNMDYCD